MASVASARGAGGGIMTEKAVRQLRTNFERLGARLGENLAGAFSEAREGRFDCGALRGGMNLSRRRCSQG